MISSVNASTAGLLIPKYCKRLMCFLMIFSSPLSFAFGDKILEQSEQIIEMGFISLLVVIGACILLAMILAFKLSKRNRTLKVQTNLNDTRDSLLDGFSVGMLHLNQSGQVVYANKVAAYFLGNRPENIVGNNCASLFEAEHSANIEAALHAKSFSKYSLLDGKNKRYLQLGVSKVPTSSSASLDITQQVTHVVSLEDISDFQKQLSEMKSAMELNNQLLQTSQMGQITLDLLESTYAVDQTFASLVDSNVDALQGKLAELERKIESKGLYAWNQAIEQLRKNEVVDFNCSFTNADNIIACRIFGLVTEYARNEKSKSDNLEPSKVHLVIQDRRDHENLKISAHTALQQTKNLLSTFPHAAYVLDEKGCFVDCNYPFETLFGLSKSQVMGRRFSDIETIPTQIKELHPASGSSLNLMSISAGKELAVTLKSESTHTLKIKLNEIKQDLGERAGLIGIIEDITKVKEIELALTEERKQFTKMLDQAPIAIARIDAEDHVVSANQTMIESLGLTEKELKKGSFYQLFNDPINSGKAAKQLHQSGSLKNFPAKLKDKQGDLHPSLLNIELFDKAKQEFLCWISDTSDQQYQQDKFDSLLRHSSMPMAVLSENGFTKLNPSACEFFGKDAEDEDELFGMFPYSEELNQDQLATVELQGKIEQIKLDGQALSLVWTHQIGDETLPCQATYVPMFKGTEFDSILCIWMDLRAINKADEARLEAINMRQAAERQIEEKQKLLRNSQDQLASKAKSLADTQTELQATRDDLSETQNEYSDLQVAHKNITDNLAQLQQDYSANRESLLESERVNAELETQLEHSSKRVEGLEKQRNNIADELQYSEKKYKQAQQELAASEENADRLKQEHHKQQQKIHGFTEQIAQLKGSIEEKDKQISDVSNQITSLQSQLSSSGQTSEKLRQQLINQRKASEAAEIQRRKLEQTFLTAQSELTNKARQVEHLQHEMNKFEEMSQQQKGDMEQQYSKLQQELESKQKQLQETEQALSETQKLSAQEKQEKAQQQSHLEKLEKELKEAELISAKQQEEIARSHQKMQEQQKELQQQLLTKQQQLQETEAILSEAKQQSEAEKAEKARQEQILAQLKAELSEMEQNSAKQKQQLAENDEQWQARQLKLKQEFEDKQRQLQQTEAILSDAKQQSEAEKAEKARQEQIFEQLKAELSEMEQKSSQQKQQLAENDQQWQARQRKLKQEVEEKQKLLQQTQQELDENQRQTDAEKRARKEQQEKLEQLKVELSDVENRASKQREMMDGSDEQWRQHHAEIEQQKIQLQQALEKAQLQNNDMKDKLQGSLQELKKAESQVSETLSAEQRLQKELDEARNQALSLEEKLQQQEAQEQKLQKQLDDQQQFLRNSEENIHALENEQQQLTEKLNSVQQEYSASQQTLNDQDSNQSELQQKLQALEQELQSSKQQLDDKEQALQSAQQELENSQALIEEQEDELVAAHKEELAQAKVEEKTDSQEPTPEFANIDLPVNPEIWFDLLPYLQSNPPAGPLPIALKAMMNDFYQATISIDKAVEENSARDILLETRKLAKLSRMVNSAPLIDLATRLETDCQQGQVDSISIFWPNARQSIMKTLRVIYSHLHS